MTERDQKMKITHKAATTYRKASQCRSDMSTRALSVRKKSATPWIMLTRVSSMLMTTESSSRRPSLDGFTTRLVTAQSSDCQGSEAPWEQGLVTLTLPKAEHVKPRKDHSFLTVSFAK